MFRTSVLFTVSIFGRVESYSNTRVVAEVPDLIYGWLLLFEKNVVKNQPYVAKVRILKTLRWSVFVWHTSLMNPLSEFVNMEKLDIVMWYKTFIWKFSV